MIDVKWTQGSVKHIILLVMSAGFCTVSCTLGNTEDLYNTTILSIDRRFRPTLNQHESMMVKVSLILISLVDVDEVQQRIASNVLLTVSWLDELRQWNSTSYGGLTKVHPDPLDIWRPRLFLTNSLAQRDVFEDNYAPLTLYNTGHVEWLPGGILHSSCSMQMTYFPFDTQTCTLSFTVGEDCDSVQLMAEPANVSVGQYDRNGEYIIQSSQVASLCLNGKSVVKFTMKLDRMPSFSLLNMVIPVNIISSLSSLSFIMPVRSGERVSFSVTVLLSLTVYTSEISKELPTDSEDMPLLIMYLTSLLLHSAFSIVANLIVLIQNFGHDNVCKEEEEVDCTPNTIFSPTISSCDSTSPSGRSRSFNLHAVKNTTFEIYNQDILNNTRKIDSLFTKLIQRLRHIFPRPEYHKKFTIDGSKRKERAHVFKTLISGILKYISVVDVILFLVCFAAWFVITVVFMTLLAFGDDQ